MTKHFSRLLLLLLVLAVFSCGSSDDDDSSDDDSDSGDDDAGDDDAGSDDDSAGDDDDDDDDDSGDDDDDDDNDDDDNDDDDMFSDRDLEQVPDLSDAQYITLSSGQNKTITAEGVYVISGNVTNASVIVNAGDEAKVQLVLDGVTVTNEDAPVVYVKAADKVFVTTAAGSSNYMEVTGTFVPDGTTNLDAVIFSKEDLTLNGTGSLEIVSAEGNGVTSKDDLKITGGTLILTTALDSLEANNSIRICGGEMTIDSDKDALHSEYDEDDTVGFIYISGGTLNITAADDGIRGTSYLQIDGGTIHVTTSREGMEATYIEINSGDINIYASDDGVNATEKSTAYSVMIVVNGGTSYVRVGPGDTDAFDSNGDIYINNGTITVIAPTSAFDCNNIGEINGGTVTVNGVVITEITCEGGPPTPPLP